MIKSHHSQSNAEIPRASSTQPPLYRPSRSGVAEDRNAAGPRTSEKKKDSGPHLRYAILRVHKSTR